jgi:hypothetical protein
MLADTSETLKGNTMFKTFITPALIAVTLAGGAYAAPTTGVNPGTAQLALFAGVQADKYTADELIQIVNAKRNNDISTLNFYLNGENRAAPSPSLNAGDIQLARIVGVVPGEYSANELNRIIDARRNNNTNEVAFILNHGNRVQPADASVVTPGEAQLAAELGVDPAAFTLSELTTMYAAKVSANNG